MLSAADTSLKIAEQFFAPFGISPAYISPTQTGLRKSIMDATESIRSMLRRAGLHDFDKQPQGQDHKKVLRIELHHDGGVVVTTASLYRPETKSGDPRIWISLLGRYVKAGNLIALIPLQDGLRALVISSKRLQAHLSDPTSPLHQELLANSPGAKSSEAATELLRDLQSVAGSGWLPAVRHGDTAVGMTLERALGIAPNARSEPDYKGFEIKAKVLRIGVNAPEDSTTRQTLFACVPDWDISPFGSSRAILVECGIPDQETGRSRRRLYCETSSKRPNSQGLQLRVDHSAGQLVEFRTAKVGDLEIARWRRERLEEKLNLKHAQTAWVYARERMSGGHREFRYFHANLTAAPRSASFLNLLDSGVISVDHLIKETLQGRVSEKGPLFRMHASDFGLLFPYRRSVSLTAS